MAYKFRFFAQPITTNIKTFFESAFLELAIGIICAVFAFASYGVFIHLFVACVIISFSCFCLSVYNVAMLLKG